MGRSINSAYRAALDYLYGFIDYERKSGWKYNDSSFSLDRMRSFLVLLGSPHKKGRFVHIAGTNGKGSVAAMIAKSLSVAGLKTGLYTSPHLLSFRERIRIDGVSIPHEAVVESVERLRSLSDTVPGLTFFEVWTALAFDYFAGESTDIAVMETGLGGRLDATNVIIPEISVLTSISMDHCGILGNDLAAIAREKAGIIKQDIPVVSAAQKDDALRVIEESASGLNAELYLSGRDFSVLASGTGASFSGRAWNIGNVRIGLNGAVQDANAAVALAALEQLSGQGIPLTREHAVQGLAAVSWPGRLHIVAEKPEIILDGACNTGAVEKLLEFAESRECIAEKVAVIAMCRDKEVGAVLSLLAGYVSHIVFTAVENPRALAAEDLSSYLPDYENVTAISDPFEAIDAARSIAGENGQVLVTGSLYLVGEAFRYLGIENLDRI